MPWYANEEREKTDERADAVVHEEGGSIGVGAYVCAMAESADGVFRTLVQTFAVGAQRGALRLHRPRKIRRRGKAAAGRVRGGRRRRRGAGSPDLRDGSAVPAERRHPVRPLHLLQAIKDLFGATLEAGYLGLRLSADVP